ncbi:T9SS type A sorting domain-containing protein [Candidatus Fermentibacteria bacterium]|nr:T9SS type A sorting domain-containing protein [Candidatus Fermentibacteria bacterium]
MPLVSMAILLIANVRLRGGEAVWQTQGVDTPHLIGSVTDHALRRGSDGVLRLACGGQDGLFYFQGIGSEWAVWQIPYTGGREVNSAALAIDGQDRPHIVFSLDEASGPSDFCLGYACEGPSGWTVTVVDTVGNTGYWPSATIDSRGRLHAVYHRHDQTWSGTTLVYAVLDESCWQFESIGGATDPGAWFSLAIDSYDCPHISYFDQANLRLMYAYFDEIAWDVEVVDTGFVGQDCSIALTESDDPRVSYYDGRARNLKYAQLLGTTWVIEAVDSLGSVGQYTSLVLDPEGCPHISYLDASPPSLKHATKRNGIWEVETVLPGAYPNGTSLVCDQSGTIISFFDVESSWLLCARQEGPTWAFDSLDRSGMIYNGLALASEAGDGPVVAYHDESSTDLRCARQNRDGWVIEVVDAEGETGDDPSIGVGQDGALHVSYCDWGNKDLKRAWEDGTGWRIETVDAGGNVGRYTSLAVDGSGAPCISYYDESNDALKYARRGAGGWEIEQAAAAGGRYTSVALDQTGMPHISHYHLSQQDLKYTCKTGGGWTTEALDKPGNVGSCSSIALDAAGRPHISYLEIIANTCPILAWVKHAYRGEAGWEIEVVDQSRGYSNTSIRLDGAGHPCIAFSGVEGGLWFARREDGGWRIEVADSSQGAGCCPSLGIGPDGVAHIAHTDRDRYDLLYTHSTGVGVEGPYPVSNDVRLLSICPNPARDRVSIVYSGGEPDRVILRVYDLAGRLVAVPSAGAGGPGRQSVAWKIKESEVGAGAYVVRIESEDAKVRDQREVVVVR